MSDVELEPQSLYAKFRNVIVILPDKVVTGKKSGKRFHRADAHNEEPVPKCQATQSDWVAVPRERALGVGRSPCHSCFEAVLDYFARLEDSAVEYRYPEFDEESDAAIIDEEDLAAPSEVIEELSIDKEQPARPPLTTPPRVILNTSGSNLYHAPTVDGAYCGVEASFQRHPYEAIAGHYEPCQECFDVESLSEDGSLGHAVGDD